MNDVLALPLHGTPKPPHPPFPAAAVGLALGKSTWTLILTVFSQSLLPSDNENCGGKQVSAPLRPGQDAR